VTLPQDLVEELRAFSRLMAERPGNAAWCDPLAWQWRRVDEASSAGTLTLIRQCRPAPWKRAKASTARWRR